MSNMFRYFSVIFRHFCVYSKARGHKLVCERKLCFTINWIIRLHGATSQKIVNFIELEDIY